MSARSHLGTAEDLVDEQSLQAGVGTKHGEELEHTKLQLFVVRDVVTIQKVGRTRPVRLQRIPELQLEPCALAVLPRPADQDDRGLLRHLVQPENEAERPRLFLVLGDLRPEVVAVDLAGREQPVPFINVHDVDRKSVV